MWSELRNIISFARKPGALQVLRSKIYSRFFDSKGSLPSQENLIWLDEQAIKFPMLAAQIDAELWSEAEKFGKSLNSKAKKVLAEINVALGGGGFYELLYFLTRKYSPTNILETGVAAGFSSASFLAAIEQNMKGTLYSSDFPYFRIENPEKFIGILVETQLRTDWQLFLGGDKANFDEILPNISKIDLFHYDSDKRYRAKWLAYQRVRPYLNSNANVLFDDIQDDAFFHDLVKKEMLDRADWDVIMFEGKFIGWIRLREQLKQI
jgi:predicted O-methyltransferase YrrM